MFREFRQVTNHILSRESQPLKIQFHETFKYMKWVHWKLKTDKDFFNGFLQKKGIINAREAFFLEQDKDFQDDFRDLKDQKILIIPISIVGSGKTTLGKLLKFICPVSYGHVQSDRIWQTLQNLASSLSEPSSNMT